MGRQAGWQLQGTARPLPCVVLCAMSLCTMHWTYEAIVIGCMHQHYQAGRQLLSAAVYLMRASCAARVLRSVQPGGARQCSAARGPHSREVPPPAHRLPAELELTSTMHTACTAMQLVCGMCARSCTNLTGLVRLGARLMEQMDCRDRGVLQAP
jgi:hypothetical protein